MRFVGASCVSSVLAWAAVSVWDHCWPVVSGRQLFVGRSQELGQLHRALTDARAGLPGLMWIEGPGGIGKTALVRYFVERTVDAECLWASACQDEAAAPWELLRQLVRRAPTPMRDSLAGVRSRLLPDPDPASVISALVEGFESFREVVVVVLDDVALADEASAHALRSAFCRVEAPGC